MGLQAILLTQISIQQDSAVITTLLKIPLGQLCAAFHIRDISVSLDLSDSKLYSGAKLRP